MLVDRQVGLYADWQACKKAGSLAGRQAGRAVSRQSATNVGRLTGGLAGWQAGRMVDRNPIGGS